MGKRKMRKHKEGEQSWVKKKGKISKGEFPSFIKNIPLALYEKRKIKGGME